LGIYDGPFGHAGGLDLTAVGNGDAQAADHRQIIRAGDGVDPEDFGLSDFPPQQPFEGQGAGNGVRIGNNHDPEKVIRGYRPQKIFVTAFLGGGLGKGAHGSIFPVELAFIASQKLWA
jgi:hypothetical protein